MALVQLARRVARLDAQAERGRSPPRLRLLDQRLQQLVADAVAALGRHDRDRELGRRLVDEAVARLGGLEDPVPGRADREAVLERDHRRVAGPAPRRARSGRRASPGTRSRQ